MENMKNYDFTIERAGHIFIFRASEEIDDYNQLQIQYKVSGEKESPRNNGFYNAMDFKNGNILFYSLKLGNRRIDGLKVNDIKIETKLTEMKKNAITAKENAKEKEKNDIEAGKIPIKLQYHDGEYLSGYMVFGHAAKLLEKLDLAKYVSGWGTHVESKLVEALGENFTYPEVVEFIKPAMEEKAKKQAQKQAELQKKFNEAKTTGKPVVICSYMVECTDPKEECNYDNIIEYAMPDGTTKTKQFHTW